MKILKLIAVIALILLVLLTIKGNTAYNYEKRNIDKNGKILDDIMNNNDTEIEENNI